MAIMKVALVGANGNVGSVVLKTLLRSNQFEVTVLTRSDSNTSSIPDSVKIHRIDYTNPSTLVEALKGQDAVISNLNNQALTRQTALIDAAVSAGVRRFIPSEFGSDTQNPKSRVLPVFAEKIKQQQYLKELADQGKISYTLVVTGPFLDMAFTTGFLGLDLKKKQVTYYDGGASTFSTTTIPDVAKAVEGVLTKLEETKNRAVYVQSAAVTMRDLVKLSKQALGEEGWTEIDGGTTEENEKSSYAKLAAGQHDMGVLMGFLSSAVYREGYGAHFQHLDNELLGVTQLKESEIVELARKSAGDVGPTLHES